VLLFLGAALTTATVAADTTSVRLAFSGRGTSEYNKWLYENAKECPGLTPIYVRIDSEAAGGGNRHSYYVSFLNDTGAVARQSTFTGARDRRAAGGRWRWMYARPSDEGDALFVCPQLGLTAVYTQSGDSAFTSTEGVIGGAGGLYFREFVGIGGGVYRNLVEVIDSRGRSSDTIGEFLEPRVQTHVWSRNKVHALYVSDSTGRVVVLDKSGKTCWQYRLGSETDAHVAISEDARFVAVATWESLVVRDMKIGHTLSRPLRRGGRGRFVGPRVAVSRDSRYVAVARFHALAHDSILLDVYTTAGAAVCTSRALCTGLVMGVGLVEESVWMVARALENPGAGSGAPRRSKSWEEPCRIVVVGFNGQMRAWDGIGPSHLHPPFKLAGNALAFYGKDSIWVYRIEPGTTEQRR